MSATTAPAKPGAEHYLQRELYERVRQDATVFEFLQSGCLDGVWYWDLEQPENEWMSPRFWESLGYDPAQMPHKASAWQDIIFAEDLELAIENFRHHCDDPNHPYDQIVRYRHADGHTVWIRCRGLAMRNEQGKPIRLLGAHTDVTSLKEAELQLQEKNDELRNFSYAISHDLKGPIGNAGLALNLVYQRSADKLDATSTRLLEEVEKSMKQMVTVIDALHQIATMEHDDYKTEALSIAEVLKQVRYDLRYDIESSHAQIELSADWRITASSVLINQVLYNLVLNAIKYAKPDIPPHIVISVVDAGDHWRFAVADNGQGIAAADLERVFDYLKRLHKGRGPAGCGLGLSFCRKAVGLMGGQIWVTSTPDVGSTFHFTVAKPATRSTSD